MRNAPMPHGPVRLPIDGTLDLHTFRPEEVKNVVTDYLAACREQGILEVRIIHGKGIGTLREIVHAALSRMPEVDSYRLADETGERWGATIVKLKQHSQREGAKNAKV